MQVLSKEVEDFAHAGIELTPAGSGLRSYDGALSTASRAAWFSPFLPLNNPILF